MFTKPQHSRSTKGDTVCIMEGAMMPRTVDLRDAYRTKEGGNDGVSTPKSEMFNL